MASSNPYGVLSSPLSDPPSSSERPSTAEPPGSISRTHTKEPRSRKRRPFKDPEATPRAPRRSRSRAPTPPPPSTSVRDDPDDETPPGRGIARQNWESAPSQSEEGPLASALRLNKITSGSHGDANDGYEGGVGGN